MKFYKLIFLNSMILGTSIAISSYSWLSMWMGLEINLLSIIPLFLNSKNMLSSESSMKYFMTQALASLILLMSVILMLLTKEFINPLMNFYLSMMMNTAILTKLGAAPFHFWFPEVIEGLNWTNSLILLTWQKIAPMMILMNIQTSSNLIMFSIVMSLISSTMGSFNQISMRKILAFSSINHIAWMLTTLFSSFSAWTVYFITYSIININIIMTFKSFNLFYMNQLPNIMNQGKMNKLFIMTNFLSLGGLPPFLGFFPKWIVINWMTQVSMSLLTFILIATTLIMLFIYIRIILSSLVMSHSESKIHLKYSNSFPIMIMNSTSILGLIFCTMISSFL